MRYNFHQNQFTEHHLQNDRVAVSGTEKDLTWMELESKVIGLTHLLKESKIKEGHPILIYGHKESEFVVAILTCLKNQWPYIPIDVVFPVERIKKIVNQINADIILNCTNESLAIDRINEIFLQNIDTSFRVASIKSNEITVANEIISYIIFTSGTTGEPKGVQISRKNLLSFIDWTQSKDYGFHAEDVFMNQSPFSFDVSLYDTLSALTLGSTVVLNSTDFIKNADFFLNRLIQYKCSVWISTPALAYLYLANPEFNGVTLPLLKTFVFAGEPLPKRTVKLLLERFGGCKVFNAYGPTEATVTTTLVDVTHDILDKYPDMPIGYPKNGDSILLTETDDEGCGEINISGNHVSPGYLNNPELTETKFYKLNGAQTYKTGDIGYFKDGLVFYKGRIDDQVKFHGYRIELGEIDTTISAIPFIRNSVTVAIKKDMECKKIVSFIQFNESISADIREGMQKVTSIIKEKLPYYMIPGDMVMVEVYPENANGKTDKKKLLENYLGGMYKLS